MGVLLPSRVLGLAIRNGGQSLLQQVTPKVLAAGGALYDPSDLTSLYQSRTGGSTGAVDSVVGIMLDKSNMGGKTAAAYIAGQSNAALNPDFASDTVWIKPTGCTIAGGVASFSSVATGQQLYQTWTTPGWYCITFTVSNYVAGSVQAFLHGTGASGPTISANGSISALLYADGSVSRLAIRTVGTTTLDVDNVSIQAIPGFHALAPSDAARPILRSASSKHYLDADGSDDWMQIFPTLNLGEQWWHVGGWRADGATEYSFALSNAASGRGALRHASSKLNWRNAADTTYSALTASDATAVHVLTLEDDTNISARLNGVAEAAGFAPYDDSGSTQGLALFSASNAAWSAGLDGRFYGGAFAPGTLSSADRSLMERFAAQLAGVAL